MSHCHDEHHGHDHADGAHSHDDDLTPAIQSSLYKHIDFDKINTFNEAVTGSGKAIIQKTWEERLDDTKVLESDADEQLLIFVPFTGQVRLHALLLRVNPSPTAPKTVKLFINRDDLDFSTTLDVPAVQTLEVPLPPPGMEVMEVPVKRALFNNTGSLTIFIAENHSDGEEDVTSISYLGFKGDFMGLKKAPVVTLYEAAPNPADHKNLVPGAEFGGSFGLGNQRDAF